jgi:hypothetical protein
MLGRYFSILRSCGSFRPTFLTLAYTLLGMICGKKYLLLLGFLSLSLSLWAQFPTNTNSNRPGGIPNSFQPPGSFVQNQGFQVDTLGSDSVQRPNIKPDTRFVDRSKLFVHLPYDREKSGFDVAEILYWDELDQADGFVQDLGQTGKPYQVLHHGFSERYRRLNFWKDPIYGRYNRYMIDPASQVQYFDTRTPYTNVDYAQGPTTLHVIKVTAAQNITPFWNIGLHLSRHQSIGTYRSFVTDQYGLYLSSNFHTQNKRYWLFANGTYNNLSDELNGGVPRPYDVSYEVVDGVVRDTTGFYDDSFFKGGASPHLDEAQAQRAQRGIYVDQYFHLWGYPGDTIDRAQRLTLRGTLFYQSYNSTFTDFNINTSRLLENLVPVYPTLVLDSAYLNEADSTRLYQATGEGSYTLAFGTAFRLNVNGGIRYERFVLRKDDFDQPLNVTEQNVRGELTFPGFVARADLQQRLSNLFSAERNLGLEAELYPLRFLGFKHGGGEAAADTSANSLQISPDEEDAVPDGPEEWARTSPVKLFASYDFRDMNPSFFQAYYPSRGMNNYKPNPDLVNQQFSHLNIGATFRQQAPIVGQDTLLPMYATVNAFFHTANRFIYYTPKLQAQQAAREDDMRWVGAEARFRLRFLKHFFLESNLTVQQSFTSGTGSLALYAQSVPNIYGKASLYWDVRWRSFAQAMRIGVDFHSNTPFVGMTVDPLTQEFFPTNYLLPFYPRVDVFATVQLRGVGVFARFIHANEGFPRSGYYTTPFYPGLERALTFGCYWTFFD